MDSELLQGILAHPLLSCLSPDVWWGALVEASPRHLAAGEVLYRRGDPAETLYILVRGSVSVGCDATVVVPAGQILGCSTLAPGKRHESTAVAMEPATVWRVSADRLRDHLDRHFDDALAMVGRVAASLRRHIRQISDLRLQSTTERLAGYLLELAEKGGRDAGVGVTVTLPVTKQELASSLGMDPATLSRGFGKLRPFGVTRGRGAMVHLADAEGLRRMATPDWRAEDEEEAGKGNAISLACPCRPLCYDPAPTCSDTGPPPANKARASLVRTLPLFADLDNATLHRLLAGAHPITMAKGGLLFTAGTVADCFYVVLSGRIKLYALLPDGRESVIEVIGPVSSFGEAAMLAGGAFPVTAEAVEDTVLVRIGRPAFLATLHADHAVVYRMLAGLCGWHQRLAGQSQRLRSDSAERRVVEYLLGLTSVAEGPATIHLPFTKEVLASHVGIRRESLSRVLARLRDHGVSSHGQDFAIEDVAALREAV